MSVLRSVEASYTVTADNATATNYLGQEFQVTQARHTAFISATTGEYFRTVTLYGHTDDGGTANTTLASDGSWLPWLPQPSFAFYDLVDEMRAAAKAGAK